MRNTESNLLAFPGVSRPIETSALNSEVSLGGAPLSSCPQTGQESQVKQGAETLGSEVGHQYEEVFDRLSDRVRAGDRIASSERENAPIRYAELLGTPVAERSNLVNNDSQFHCYLLAEMLLERSREFWFDDAKQSRGLAELAVAIADRLDEEFYGLPLKQSIQVRAWTFLGNGFRIESNIQGARDAFLHVDSLIKEAVLDPSELAEALSMKVSFLKEIGQFDEARSLLTELSQIYRSLDDLQNLGKALILRGLIEGDSGNPREAVELFAESLELVEERRDPKLYSGALVNFAAYLNEVDRSEEALEVLANAGKRMQRSGDRINLARVRWVEGRIASSMGFDALSEEALLEAQEFFVQRGAGRDAVLVGLDLALVYSRLNKTAELKELAQQMLPICASQMLGREAMAAIILFQHAAEKELATFGLIEEISKYLKSAQVGSSLAADGSPA